MAHTDWKSEDLSIEVLPGDAWIAKTPLGEMRGADASSDAPTVEDTDLARWLEFTRERSFKTLIARHAELGNITPVSYRYTVQRFTRDGRPTGTVEATGFRLTQPDALFIVTQAGTPKSVVVTKAVIAIFLAVMAKVRAGLDLTALVAELRAQRGQLEAQSAELATVRAQLAEPASVYLVPTFRAAQLRALLDGVVHCLVRLLPHKSSRSLHTTAENEMRAGVGFPRSREHRLEYMPFEMWERAMLITRSRLGTLQLAMRGTDTQLELVPAPKEPAPDATEAAAEDPKKGSVG